MNKASHVDYYYYYVRGFSDPKDQLGFYIDNELVEAGYSFLDFLDSNIEQGKSSEKFYLFKIPEGIWDGRDHLIEVRKFSDGSLLSGYPIIKNLPNIEKHKNYLLNILGNIRWCIDYIEIENNLIKITGWILPINNQNYLLAVNGKVIENQQHGGDRLDIGSLFPYIPNSRSSGFNLSFDYNLFKGYKELEFTLVDSKTGIQIPANKNYYYPLAQKCSAFPSAPQMTRVSGVVNSAPFELGGYTLFRKIEEFLISLGYGGYGSFANILDWGCGSGRLTRHLINTSSAITGADIDLDNINWCKENLALIDAVHISVDPPTKFLDSSFNLVIGNSVMTHLSEIDQFLWLKELARIILPGGLALLTTLNATDLFNFIAKFSENDFQKFLTKGYFDYSDPAMDGFVPENYYRVCFHSRNYIKNKWSEYFRVVKIVPNFSNNHQDLVVLMRI